MPPQTEFFFSSFYVLSKIYGATKRLYPTMRSLLVVSDPIYTMIADGVMHVKDVK